MVEWPPRDAAKFRRWLIVGLPALRDRQENLVERIEEGKAVLHQPVTAHLSQINVARTTTSDPTHTVVALWADEIPEMERELRRVNLILHQYERAKSDMEQAHRRVIEGLYDLHMGMAEICESTGISERTFYRYLEQAIEFLAARIGR